MDKDLPLKLRFRRILLMQGYWTPLEVELSHYENRGPTLRRRSLTDLDVLGIRFDSLFTRHCIVGDCKSGKNVSDANRLFWIRGVMDYFGADQGYYLRPSIDSHIATIAPRMRVRAVSTAELHELDLRLGIGKETEFLLDPNLYQQMKQNWGIDVATGRSPDATQLRLKQVYSYLTYSYWYVEQFRNLMQLVGAFEAVADILLETDQRHILLAYVGAERFAHCLLEAASHLQSQAIGDLPKFARSHFYGGVLGLREKERFMKLLQKLTGGNESLDPAWLNNTIELLNRIVRNPRGGVDLLRYLSFAYIWCVVLRNSSLPDWISAERNIDAIVLAKDVALEFAKATGIRRSMFQQMDSL